MDTNTWKMGPIPNQAAITDYNYISGICGVVKTSDGEFNLTLSMNICYTNFLNLRCQSGCWERSGGSW